MLYQVARPFELFSAFGPGHLVDDMATDVAIDFVVYVVDVLFELAQAAKWLVASIDQACELLSFWLLPLRFTTTALGVLFVRFSAHARLALWRCRVWHDSLFGMFRNEFLFKDNNDLQITTRVSPKCVCEYTTTTTTTTTTTLTPSYDICHLTARL